MRANGRKLLTLVVVILMAMPAFVAIMPAPKIAFATTLQTAHTFIPSASSSTHFITTLTGTVTSGDFITVEIASSAANVTGVTDALGNTYHKGVSYTLAMYLNVWYANVTTGGSSDWVNVTLASSDYGGIIVTELSGVTNYDTSSSAYGSGTALAVASFSPGTSTLVQAFGWQSSSTESVWTAGADFGLSQHDGGAANSFWFGDEYNASWVSGATTAPMASSKSGFWQEVAVSYSIAASPPANASISFNTSPSGYVDGLAIDGTNYTGPTSFNWTVGSTHNITANNEVNSTWVIWASTYSNVTFFDSTAQQTNLTVLGDDSVTANFNPPQPVAFDTGPASGYANGLTIDGVNYTGPVTLYWMMGSSHNITANDETGLTFTHWTQYWGNVVFGSATANQTTVTIYGNDNITANFASPILLNDSFGTTNICPTSYFSDTDCWGNEALNSTVYHTAPSSGDVAAVPNNASAPFAWVSSYTTATHIYLSASVYVSGIATDDSTDSPFIEIGDYSYGSPILAVWYTDSSGWNIDLATGSVVPLGGNITQGVWVTITIDWDVSAQANFTVNGVLMWSGDSGSTGMVNPSGVKPTVGIGHSGYFIDVHGYAAVNTPTYLVDDVVVANVHLNSPSPPVQYWVTYADDGNGHGNQTSGFVDAGTVVNVLATPNGGYQFLNFVDSVNGNSTANPYSFTVTANMTITAYFELIIPQYYVTYANDGHGSLNGTSGFVNNGTSVTILATPNSNYLFLNFVDSLAGNSTNNPYTFVVTANVTITGYFYLVQWYIGFATDGHGTVNQTARFIANGTLVTVLATPNANYAFDHFEDHYLSPSVILTNYSNPYTLLVDGNQTITAYFYNSQYVVSLAYFTQDGSSTTGIQVSYTFNGTGLTINLTKSYQGVAMDVGTFWTLPQYVQVLPDGWLTTGILTANVTGTVSYNFSFVHGVAYTVVNGPNNDLGYAPFQHKYFRTANLYWQFYQTGTQYYFTTSTDGATWSAPTAIYNDTTGTPISRDMAVAFDSTSSGARVHVVIQTADHKTLIYRTGITAISGTITWSQAWQTITTSASGVYNYPNIALDSLKLPWVSVDDTTTGDVAKVWRSTTSSGLWTTAAGFPVTPDSGGIGYRGAFVALTGGKMYFMDTDPKVGFTYIDTRTILPNGSMTAFVNTTHAGSDSFDGIGIGDVAHVVFGSWSGGTYYFNYTYATNSIGPEVQVNATEFYSTIARDTDFLYVLMADATNNMVSWRAMNLTSFAWGSTDTATFDTNGLLLNGIQSESYPNSTKILTFTFASIDPTSGYDLRWSWLNTTVDPPTVTVTFTTNPILTNALNVDGTNYTGPQTFVWYVDTLHSIQAFDITGYTFGSWSDGGAQAHLIYALDSIDGLTYTATFSLAASTIMVTVDTNPSALAGAITVDGVTYTGPHSFNWTMGSLHTLGTVGTVNDWQFSSWSDGGAQSHSVSPTMSGSYVASYVEESSTGPVQQPPVVVPPSGGSGSGDNGTLVVTAGGNGTIVITITVPGYGWQLIAVDIDPTYAWVAFNDTLPMPLSPGVNQLHFRASPPPSLAGIYHVPVVLTLEDTFANIVKENVTLTIDVRGAQAGSDFALWLILLLMALAIITKNDKSKKK
jgi:hypothetical protein